MKYRSETVITTVSTIKTSISLASVWLKLTGETQTPENDAMARGNALEPVVAAMYAANHPEYAVETMGTVCHHEFPYLIGSPDRVLIQNGELVAGLEIKTANIISVREWGEEETDQIPEHYLLQSMWYAGLLNVPVWYVAVGFVPDGKRKIITYREYEVPFRTKLFEAMLNRAVTFWTEHVEKRIPPPITEADPATVEYYRSKYPAHDPGKWLDLTPEIERTANRLMVARESLSAAEKEFELQKTLLIAALGDHEGLSLPYGKITYKTSKPSQKTDWKAVADAVSAPPEIINQFTQEIPGSRRLLLPKMKG